MSLIDGVSTCWDLGTNGCVVWWDAWSVIVAYLALCVGVINIFVAAAAAIAVFWLGRQANTLAGGAHRQATAEREREDRKAAAKQQREEGVVLCYLAAEISAATKTIRVMNMLMATEFMNESGFITNTAARSFLFRKADAVQIPLIDEWVPKLHEIGADTGMRLARFAGDIRSLKLHLATMVQHDKAAQVSDGGDVDAESQDGFFKAGYGMVKLLVDRAETDIRILNERAFVTGITLDSRLDSLA